MGFESLRLENGERDTKFVLTEKYVIFLAHLRHGLK